MERKDKLKIEKAKNEMRRLDRAANAATVMLQQALRAMDPKTSERLQNEWRANVRSTEYLPILKLLGDVDAHRALLKRTIPHLPADFAVEVQRYVDGLLLADGDASPRPGAARAGMVPTGRQLEEAIATTTGDVDADFLKANKGKHFLFDNEAKRLTREPALEVPCPDGDTCGLCVACVGASRMPGSLVIDKRKPAAFCAPITAGKCNKPCDRTVDGDWWPCQSQPGHEDACDGIPF